MKGHAMKLGWVTAIAFWCGLTGMATAQVTDALVGALSEQDVVFLGEIHDNPYHHESQAALINALAPSAVVFEMLSAGQAETLRGHDITDAQTLDTALGWTQSGWPTMDIYFPVFQALGDAIPYGAAQPRFVMMSAYQNGAAGSLGPASALYGLNDPLDADMLDQRVTLQFEAHCEKMPREMMPSMVSVQRMRNAALADAALTALAQTGGPVVVITGNGHARRDWGAPYMGGLAAPDVAVASVGHLEDSGDMPGLYDYALVTPSVARDDPCASIP